MRWQVGISKDSTTPSIFIEFAQDNPVYHLRCTLYPPPLTTLYPPPSILYLALTKKKLKDPSLFSCPSHCSYSVVHYILLFLVLTKSRSQGLKETLSDNPP